MTAYRRTILFKDILLSFAMCIGVSLATVLICSTTMKKVYKHHPCDKQEMIIGEYSKAQVINIVARTLYGECGEEPEDGKLAVMGVIYNRAAGNPANYTSVCLRNKQFSCWNKLNPSIKPNRFGKDNYEITTPFIDNDNWKQCVKIATDFVNSPAAVHPEVEKLVGDSTNFINPKRANKFSNETWGRYCTKKIGNHNFGYIPEEDGFMKHNVKSPYRKHQLKDTTVRVKNGDTMDSISKKFKTSPETIRKLNNLDNDNIQEGESLNLLYSKPLEQPQRKRQGNKKRNNE